MKLNGTFVDAKGSKLNVRKLIYENGTSVIVTVERVDSPDGVAGTPLNAETFNTLLADIRAADAADRAIIENLKNEVSRLAGRILELENFKASITSSGTPYRIYGAVAN